MYRGERRPAWVRLRGDAQADLEAGSYHVASWGGQIPTCAHAGLTVMLIIRFEPANRPRFQVKSVWGW